MTEISSQRMEQFARMRETARGIFASALKNASIENAFARNVHCERRLLRIGDDLHDLDTYNRVFVVSIGKAAHTMAAALGAQCGSTFEGMVASSVDASKQQSVGQIRGFRYFHGGHPTPTEESVRAADAVLKSLRALDPTSLAIFMISGGGSSIVGGPGDDQSLLPG